MPSSAPGSAAGCSAAGSTTTGFTVFAAAGVFSPVFIGLTDPPSLKGSPGKDTTRPLSAAG
ncbi:hypothetical protein [[Kitasatospora] papulosa]|uniref:hypothetical protein n=1 Tax=[Kitasatospora] papulosa TaxID=1464011 RepID=UPI0036C1E113